MAQDTVCHLYFIT